MIWYLARLDLQSGGVIGATIPGVPAVLSGRSDGLGWGVTSSFLDDQDVFIEQLNPDNLREYLTPEGYKPFRTRRSILRIKDAEPVTLTLRWSENGPVLPGTEFDLADVTPVGHVAALSWTILTGADTTMSAAMALMRAQNVDEGLEAGRRFIGPSQNLTLVDHSTIALKIIGAMPRRNPAQERQGRMPSRGWVPENRWRGIGTYADNPEFLAPKAGCWAIPTTRSLTGRFRGMSVFCGGTRSGYTAGDA